MRRLYLYILNKITTVFYKFTRKYYCVWYFFSKRYFSSLSRIGYLNAYCICAYSSKKVPAYKTFLEENNFKWKFCSLENYPETNKDNYVKKYDFSQRCKNGEVVIKGTNVDESSGSTGTAFNWIRSKEELHDVHMSTANWVKMEYPSKKLFTINAFSMGAWATGVNTGIALSKIGIVKSTGPDIQKIMDTIQYFGNSFDYLITGYPPFLKHLADALDKIGFDWSKHSISGLVGGEGMTEGLRKYLERKFVKVRSGYGATDIQIGIAAETDFTVWLRNQIIENDSLKKTILGENEDRIPMVFQYNPLDHYIEINEKSEVVVTVNNLAVMSPRLRYNIKDEGSICNLKDVFQHLENQGFNITDIKKKFRSDLIFIPILILYGRKDSTISYMGANIYPQDVENGLYQNSENAKFIESFNLSLKEMDNLETRPEINIELRKGNSFIEKEMEQFVISCRKGVVDYLSKVSRDFAQSISEDPSSAEIKINVFNFGEGLFKNKTNKIKNQYLIKAKT